MLRSFAGMFSTECLETNIFGELRTSDLSM